MTADTKEEVGYKKPPQQTQFRKGQSGNPTGRPKREPGLDRILAKELKARVTIQENGRRKQLRKLELIAKQVANQAVGGNLKPMIQLIKAHDLLDKLSRLPPVEAHKLSRKDLQKMSLEELNEAYRALIASTRPLPPEED